MPLPWPFAKKNSSADVNVDEEDVEAIILRNLWKRHRILPPYSVYKQYWDVIMFSFVIYNSLYIPIELSFTLLDKHPAHCSVDWLIDILFIVDMFLNFRTTYYNDENEIVLDSKVIWKRYFFSYWFVIDFLAVFPFDLTAGGGFCAQSDDGSDLTTVIKLLKALRLLRLLRFRKEIDKLSGAQLLRTIVSLSVFLLVAHWMACVWWAIGTTSFADDEVAAAGGVVICNSSAPCSWLRRTPGGGALLSPETSTLGQKYFTSLYWSLTTLMKSPSIGPDGIVEKVFATIAIALGAVFYAFFLSTVQSNFSSFNKAAAAKRDKVSSISAFSRTKELPNDLSKRLAQTTTAHFDWTTGLVNSNVLMTLPSHLRGMVALQMYPDARESSLSIFNKCSTECAKGILIRLRSQIAVQGQVVIGQGEACAILYILLRGTLRATTSKPSGHNRTSGCTTSSTSSSADEGRPSSAGKKNKGAGFRDIERPGSHLGLIEPVEPLSVGVYPMYVTAVKKTYLLYIPQSSLKQALDGFNEETAAIRELLAAEHRTLANALNIPDHPDSPLAMYGEIEEAERRAKENEESGANSVSEEMLGRIHDVEARAQKALNTIEDISQNMKALPLILDLISTQDKGTLTARRANKAK